MTQAFLHLLRDQTSGGVDPAAGRETDNELDGAGRIGWCYLRVCGNWSEQREG
jgi:hypothetical protein